MKTTTTTNHRQGKPLRNAAEPFVLPMQDHSLLLDTLLAITGKKKSRHQLWKASPVKFVSFVNATLTLTTTCGAETHTLILTIQPHQLTIACSCATPVVTLCPHAYQYLFSIASYGTHSSFIGFKEGGIIQTALSHPSLFSIQYTGRHGIRAELKNGLGRVYELENNWVRPNYLQPFQHLPGQENQTGSQPQNGLALCYLLMMSPREELAPFILPCAGVLNKEGTAIKSFTHYLSGADGGLSQWLTPGHLPRIRACTDIMKKSEASPGLHNLTEATEEETQALAGLFYLFRSTLPLFRGAILYSHPWYGKKHLGLRPVKTWAHSLILAQGTITLRFRLHRGSGVCTFSLTILIDGKPLDAWCTKAAFFVTTPAKGAPLHMFSSPRDAGIAFWMEKNKNRITVFDNHFPRFQHDILEPLRRDYELRETGKLKKHKGKSGSMSM